MSQLFGLLLKMFPALVRVITSMRTWLLGRKWGAWLIFYLAGAVGLFIKKVFEFLAISFVAYNWVTPTLVGYVSGPLLGMPPVWQSFMSMTRIDDAITVILSAVIYRMSTSFRVEKKASSPFWQNLSSSPGAS